MNEAVKKPVESITASKRRVVTEIEVLSSPCAKCGAQIGIPCKAKQGGPLQLKLNQTELSFHSERVFVAWATQAEQKFGVGITSLEKLMMVYYAFVMMSDAVAAHSKEIMGKAHLTEEVQAFFIQQAITELEYDKVPN